LREEIQKKEITGRRRRRRIPWFIES